MLVFTHRRTIHRTVIVTLVVWVFALMAGIANACLPTDHDPAPDAQVQSANADAHEVACNDSWDGGVVAVAQQACPDSTHPELADVLAGAGGRNLNLVSVAAVKQAVDDGAHAHGPPDAIRYLHLRL